MIVAFASDDSELQPDFPMISQILTYAGAIAHDFYTTRPQMVRGPDPRKLQQLWGLQRAGAQYDLAVREEFLAAASRLARHSTGARALEDDFGNRRISRDCQVGPRSDWRQKSACCADAPASSDRR